MKLITSRSLECIESLDSDYESLTILKQKMLAIDEQIRRFCQPSQAGGPFDPNFWARAARVESIYLERSELERKISLYLFEGDEASWEITDEAKAIVEQIHAREQSCKIYVKRAESHPNPLCGSVRKLFTTSNPIVGMGKVKPEDNYAEQVIFRNELIEQYQAQHTRQPWLWCPILGSWEHEYNVTAVQLFPYMHGQEIMNAIFGKKSSLELFSAQNGLLMSRSMEEHFKSGKLAIVPSISIDSIPAKMTHWLSSDELEYKIKVMDPTWELRGEYISSRHGRPTFGAFNNRKLTFGQLNDRKLVFRSSVRPAARYLYFSFCVQTLRSAWQHNCQEMDSQTTVIPPKETGKPFWGISGRYIPRSMLRAFVKELGHDYKSLLSGAKLCPFQRASNQTLLETVVHQVKSRRPVLDATLFDGNSSGSDYGDVSEDVSEDTSELELKTEAESIRTRRWAPPPKKFPFLDRGSSTFYRY
ncbi:hypothetical protein N7486_008055 [Penicillium sp. IBT 16267x]|nr:hypothetical protein N7486_008055 [Penicillium sp. IBT 16267x]